MPDCLFAVRTINRLRKALYFKFNKEHNLKPYKNLESKNFGLVLFIARAFLYLSALLFLFVLFLAIAPVKQMAFSLQILQGSIVPIAYFSVYSLIFSVTLAVIVSFEETYRKKVDAYIRSISS